MNEMKRERVNKQSGCTRLAYIFLLFISSHVLSAPELKTIKIIHPHEPVIHGWYANDLAEGTLDNSGKTDVSGLLNMALGKLFSLGGGTLYLPAGKYRLDKPVFVPPGTALRGDFVTPGFNKVDPAKNTILCAYYGRGMDAQSDPLFFLDGSSLMDGLVIWYPQQKVDRIIPYAPTIRHSERDSKWAINSATRNVFLVNAYTGIQLGKKGRGTCIQLIKNIYGSPLANGIEVWSDADIPRILEVDFNPDYWPAAGLDSSSIDSAKLKKHLFEKASGITYHRCDGSELANITIRGYHKGFNLANGHRWRDSDLWLDSEGHYVNFKITGCYCAVWINNIKNHGTQFYNCKLEGEHSAVFIDNPMHGMECAMFMGCELGGGYAAVTQSWEDKKNDKFAFMFGACTFKSPVKWTGSKLIITDCDFDFEGCHLSIGPDIKNAIVADSRFKGGRRIDNGAGSKVKISASHAQYIRPPKYTYAVNKISNYKPPQTDTVVVPAGDGDTDDAGRLQKAIDDMSQGGGGYVVLSPGLYVLNSPLVVRENVELRGAVKSWQHSKFLSYYAVQQSPKGAVIYVNYGRDMVDWAAITLEQNAGLDGLFFHYPGQEYSTQTKEVLHTYAWLIRMKGDRAYVKHVTASNPWRFIDLFTHTPKDNYIGYCTGAPLDQGIHVGEAENSMIDNVHFNSWYWNTVYFPNKPSGKTKGSAYKEQLDNWMKAHTKAFIFAGSRNVDVYGSFIFCAKQGFTLLPGKTSGKGPNGIIINSGNDWSKYGLYMHANNGLTFANMHFIDVGKFDPDDTLSSIYVAEGCRDTVSIYNLSTWGDSPRALSMHGTAKSQISLYNLSYQLYPTQENIIRSGKARIVNAVRNRHVSGQKMGYDMGPNSLLMLRAASFPTGLTVTPSQVKTDLESECTRVDFLDTTDLGVIRSYSFP
ncbi:glycosyl hydrolase family 28-related protein [Planctomycetota bacterium]